jgi:GT2 family glycosyltransferase
MPQVGPADEVIVTDDGTVAQQVPPGVRWVRGPRRGPAANRNSGASRATGEWLVFLDDDCLPEAGWLAAYAAASAPGIDVIEGRTECPQPDRFAFDDIVENLNGGACWSCNLAVRRTIFEELRGFDEDFTEPCAEDMEFAWRMRQRGLVSVFAPEAVVTHPARRMGPRALLARTAAHRWILLYRLKTASAAGLGSSTFRAMADLIIREVLDSMRMIFHLRTRERNRIKQRTLALIWRCASLAFFLPYYLYWDFKYRRMLAQRQPAIALKPRL